MPKKVTKKTAAKAKKTGRKKAGVRKTRPTTDAGREARIKQNAAKRRKRDTAITSRKAPAKLKTAIAKATETALGIVRDAHNKIILSEDKLPLVIEMAARGCREADIALALGVSPPTWVRIRKSQPEFEYALTIGRGYEHSKIRNVIYDKCIRGDRRACTFLLKTQFNYSEGGGEIEIVQNNIKITLPGALNAESYKKIIEGSATVVTEDTDND